MRIIFFGAGSFAKKKWEQIQSDTPFYVDEYIAFADNNKNLWEKYFGGKRIISPLEIHSYSPDLIVITSDLYEGVMRKQLIEDINIQEEKIYSYKEYFRLCFARNVYRKRYGYSSQETWNSLDKKSIVIYTAITGDYDILKEPTIRTDDLTYVCLTNNPHIKSNIWNVEYIQDTAMDNVHLARHIKLNPHLYFKDYEISIWVDGKYQIINDLRRYVQYYKKQSSILCFPHPERECICEELGACIFYNKGNSKDMIVQVADYIKDGYSMKAGLYETGCMVRIHNDDLVKKIMNEWECEIINYSFRDQLSFPYICWKNKFVPDICNLDINRNQWLLEKGHFNCVYEKTANISDLR